MIFRSVGNRCAVILESLKLPMSDQDALETLRLKGFKLLDVNILALARDYLGRCKYARGARMSQAPEVVDCSSFTKWLYAQRGIWVPRRSVQQREYGHSVEPGEAGALDLIFTTGFKNYYRDDLPNGVGHVGIITESGTVVHAASESLGIVESPIESFVIDIKFRGIRRYIPADGKVLTFEVPHGFDIETSDDIRWLLVQPR